MLNQYRRPSTDHPLDERVATLLEAAAAPTEPGPVPGEDEAMAAFRASHESSRRSSMLSSLKSTKVAAAALSVGVMLTGGAAVAGTLPGAAQATAHSVFAEFGIQVPGGPAEPENIRGDDEVETEEHGEGLGPEHGEKVALTTTTDAEGAEKGAEISKVASGEKSKASENRAGDNPAQERSGGHAGGDTEGAPSNNADRGSSSEAPPLDPPNDGTESDDAPPVETPAGGPESGDDASGGKSSGGADNGGQP